VELLSIAAMIIEPKDRNFYVPVSTEAFFRSCWVPAIKELQVELISFFDPGLDLIKKDLPDLINELNILTGELIEAFKEEDIIIYIG
jgi:hypothetical protein